MLTAACGSSQIRCQLQVQNLPHQICPLQPSLALCDKPANPQAQLLRTDRRACAVVLLKAALSNMHRQPWYIRKEVQWITKMNSFWTGCLAITLLAAAACAAPATVFEAAKPVDGMLCASMTLDRENEVCCNACHHPYLLALRYKQMTVVESAWVSRLSASMQQSGGSGEVSVNSTATSVDFVLQRSFDVTVPCGYCVALDDCKGRVDLWHHQCTF